MWRRYGMIITIWAGKNGILFTFLQWIVSLFCYLLSSSSLHTCLRGVQLAGRRRAEVDGATTTRIHKTTRGILSDTSLPKYTCFMDELFPYRLSAESCEYR